MFYKLEKHQLAQGNKLKLWESQQDLKNLQENYLINYR